MLTRMVERTSARIDAQPEASIMTETNDISKPAALDDHRPLADSELDAVSGGFAVDASTKVTATGASHKTEAMKE
jgi:hypothetical protein